MEDPEFRELIKAVANVSDEDMAKISPEHAGDLKTMTENQLKYKLIFEVAKSRNCMLGAKVGQKIVISGSAINTEESDCALCMGLVAPLLPSSVVFYDRCLNGNLDSPMPEGVRCIDPGLDCPEARGLGEVVVIPRIEPIS